MFNLSRQPRSILEDLFTPSFFDSALMPLNSAFKVDVSETDDSFMIEAELPGVSKEDIKLSANGNKLTISGMRQSSREIKDDKRGTILKERSSGSFSRIIPLTTNIDPKLVSAKLDNGILTIEIPKSGDLSYNSIEIQ